MTNPNPETCQVFDWVRINNASCFSTVELDAVAMHQSGPCLREAKFFIRILRCFKDGFGRCVDDKEKNVISSAYASSGPLLTNLSLPQELSRVHNTFHVSNLKKCYSDDPLVVPLEGLQVDDKLHFVEEHVEVMDREVKQLRQSRVPIVKVRWNSRQGPEFTWEREDQFRKKYPHLFTKTAPSSSAV
ncbi:hypothetical protein Tco_0637295 [Tanacetum coccineum]